MKETTTINNDYQEHINFEEECEDFERYGNLATYCAGALAVAHMNSNISQGALWAEQTLCSKSDAVADHMEALLYIDNLDPRSQVLRLNTSSDCSSTLRAKTGKVLKATDVTRVQPSGCCMGMCKWWKGRLSEVIAHHAADYEREISRTMERQEASRHEVLKFALAEVDDRLAENSWGKLFFMHEDNLPVLVKAIHAHSGNHQGEALDDLISLASQRQWVKNEIDKCCTNTPTRYPSPFRVGIPEYLRKGRLLEAWDGLVEAGYLTEDKKLEKTTKKVAAQYIVTCFCANRKTNEWSVFEKFWGISNLKTDLGEPKKADKEKIDKIFTICN